MSNGPERISESGKPNAHTLAVRPRAVRLNPASRCCLSRAVTALKVASVMARQERPVQICADTALAMEGKKNR